MKRDAYLADESVAAFVGWGSHLVRGEWRLEHSYTERKSGVPFQCNTLYGSFQNYRWNGDDFADTVRKFARFAQIFDDTDTISNDVDQDQFITNAIAVAKWGNITLQLKDWQKMRPSDLAELIRDIKRRLNPASADTDDLRGFKYMSSGYSKIYSALIPGLPIYDSRVACALACLVEIYRQGAGLPQVPPLLNLGIPPGRGNAGGRCSSPAIYGSQESKYAKANLQFAWLMQEMTADPGDFAQVPAGQRVDALQSALFMLGYARLRDDAVVKGR